MAMMDMSLGTGHAEPAFRLVRLCRSVSHAINNHIAVASGNLAILRDDRTLDDEDRAEVLNDAILALGRLQRLAGNLAAMSYWREFQEQQVSLQAFLLFRKDNWASLVGDARPEIVVHCEDGEPWVLTDPIYLELAINGLLLEAVELADTQGSIVLRCGMAAMKTSCGPSSNAPQSRPSSISYLAVEFALSETARKAIGDIVEGRVDRDSTPVQGFGRWLAAEVAIASRGGFSVFLNGSGKLEMCIGMESCTSFA